MGYLPAVWCTYEGLGSGVLDGHNYHRHVRSKFRFPSETTPPSSRTELTNGRYTGVSARRHSVFGHRGHVRGADALRHQPGFAGRPAPARPAQAVAGWQQASRGGKGAVQDAQRQSRPQAKRVEVAGVIGHHDEGPRGGQVFAADDLQAVIGTQPKTQGHGGDAAQAVNEVTPIIAEIVKGFLASTRNG
jgi:hypothetical protein